MMAKQTGGKSVQLGPAWWIAYGVVIGLGAAGLILLLASPPRGKPIELLPAPSAAATETGLAAATGTLQPQTPLALLVNINTASLDELLQLPGLGPATAQAIINYRDSHGPFTQLEDIQNVSGIGPKTFDGIKPFITIDPIPSPSP